MAVFAVVLIAAGCLFTAMAAFLLTGYGYDILILRGAVMARRISGISNEADPSAPSGFTATLVGIAHTLGVGKNSGVDARNMRDADVRLIDESGLKGYLNPEVLPALRIRMGVLVSAAFALLALVVSPALAIAGLLFGLCVGYCCVNTALAHRAKERRGRCEEELPAMLDIISLAVRAGMSFDSALEIYCQGADGLLAKLCADMQAEYLHGAKTRKRALHDLANTLSIPAFGRFVETVLQALHFGTPLAPALRILGDEVRASHRANVSERIAKAPVKMLLPMAVFILPAMLLLVLGPVVLNMVMELA